MFFPLNSASFHLHLPKSGLDLRNSQQIFVTFVEDLSMFNMKQSVRVPMVFYFMLVTTLFGGAVMQVGCLNFSYPIFLIENYKDLNASNNSVIAHQALQVTKDTASVGSISNLSGRILYKKKFKLSRGNSKASFNSSFTLNITPMTQPGGEGMAFILTSDENVPLKSDGQWLGIVNETTNGSSPGHIVAIEFDTRKSFAEDGEDNHVGVDLNTINSVEQRPLSNSGVNLSSASDVIVRIQYNAKLQNMAIFVSMNDTTGFNATNPIISLPLNLTDYLPDDVYLGFSASTGNLTELNCVKSWNFTGEDIRGSSDLLLLIYIMIPVVTLLLFGFITSYLCWRRKFAETQKKYNDQDIEKKIGNSAAPPRKFRLKELKYATKNFHSTNQLGQGGFGIVYRGFLKEINMEVAIKRVSNDSRQGMQEFIAEITTISNLKHKNLVKLIGWCYERDELLLVYEFMPNGSLDKLIYFEKMPVMEGFTLSWERRHSIVCGVASALDYLHDGCEKRVLHRDVKPSNVMLDSDLNARLGDFGLARTVQHNGETHHTTNEIAGTPGYMAPEIFLTSRASVQTDVYGFGVFVMEVACGRRPGNNIEDHQSRGNNIVDWVWDLYGKERTLDAVDPRLHNFDKEQMEVMLKLGLSCCHPNPNQRPSMRVALQVLTDEIAPPILPNEKPAFMWPVFEDDSDLSIIEGRQTPITVLS